MLVPRRLVVRALLRASGTAAALVVLYFTLPITGSVDRSTAMLLVLGLLAFAGIVTWQVRSVLRSPYPGLRAVESLATAAAEAVRARRGAIEAAGAGADCADVLGIRFAEAAS